MVSTTTPRIITLATLFFIGSFSVSADIYSNNECEVNVNGNVKVHNDSITIDTNDGTNIFINKSEQIFVNDKAVSLTRTQQKDLSVYANAIHSSVPLVVDIASDGVEIANDTVTEVLGGILGENDELVVETHSLIAEINDNLENHFYDNDGSFIIQGSDVTKEGWVNNQWEDEFEGKVENIMEKAMGKLMLKFASLMISGDDEAQETIARLETLDDDIETLVDQKASDLEAKAQQLCDLLQEADEAENALQASNVALADLNIITVR